MDSSLTANTKTSRRAFIYKAIALVCLSALVLLLAICFWYFSTIWLRNNAVFLFPTLAGTALFFWLLGRFTARRGGMDRWIFLFSVPILLWSWGASLFLQNPLEFDVDSDGQTYVAHVDYRPYYWTEPDKNEGSVELLRPVALLFFERQPVAYASIEDFPGHDDATSHTEQWPSLVQENLDVFTWE